MQSGLVGVAFRLERFFPQFIGYLLRRRLREYKKKGQISDYRVRLARKGKYHYVFQVDLFLEKPEGR